MKSACGRFEYWDLDYMPVPAGSTADQVHRVAYRCRSNPKSLCSLNLRGRGHDIPQRSWSWDGNVDHPTFAPSINCQMDGCGWHGFIEGGVYNDQHHQPEPDQRL